MEFKYVRLLLISLLQTGTNSTYTNKKMHKYTSFFYLGVCLFDFDLEKGHNLILSFDLKRVYAVLLTLMKKDELAF